MCSNPKVSAMLFASARRFTPGGPATTIFKGPVGCGVCRQSSKCWRGSAGCLVMSSLSKKSNIS